MPVPLYCFICHRGTPIAQRERIRTMMEVLGQPYLICDGGATNTVYDSSASIVHLKCDDSYAGLPDKMMALFKFLATATEFASYTHFVKLDEDMRVLRPLLEIDIQGHDYIGRVYATEGNRRYHVGRCPGSSWNTRPYEGPFVPYCLGGYGYIVSRKAVEMLAIASKILTPADEIYEDLMVGKILRAGGIRPVLHPKLSAMFVGC